MQTFMPSNFQVAKFLCEHLIEKQTFDFYSQPKSEEEAYSVSCYPETVQFCSQSAVKNCNSPMPHASQGVNKKSKVKAKEFLTIVLCFPTSSPSLQVKYKVSCQVKALTPYARNITKLHWPYKNHSIWERSLLKTKNYSDLKTENPLLSGNGHCVRARNVTDLRKQAFWDLPFSELQFLRVSCRTSYAKIFTQKQDPCR